MGAANEASGSGNLCAVAILAYRNAQYMEAASFLEQALLANPKHWLARLYLSLSYAQLKRTPDAIANLRMIIDECPAVEIEQRAQELLQQLEGPPPPPSGLKDVKSNY